jgi:hypothetical protein
MLGHLQRPERRKERTVANELAVIGLDQHDYRRYRKNVFSSLGKSPNLVRGYKPPQILIS